MRVVVQRVSRASVKVEGDVAGAIDRGLLCLVGAGPNTSMDDIAWLARKVAGLRVFEDDTGKMNLSMKDVDGACLVVSQFTLYGDCRKGFRPSFTGAASPEKGREDVDRFVRALRGEGVPVETGVFAADMQVELINNGPVTVVLAREGGVLS